MAKPKFIKELQDIKVDVGKKDELQTIDKDSLVEAINETHEAVINVDSEMITKIEPISFSSKPSAYPIGMTTFTPLIDSDWYSEDVLNTFGATSNDRIIVETTANTTETYCSIYIFNNTNLKYTYSRIGSRSGRPADWSKSLTKIYPEITQEDKDKWNTVVDGSSIESILNRGENIVDANIDSAIDIARIEGRTIVNHAPLFDSGLWSGDKDYILNSSNKYTLNATKIHQFKSVDIRVKPNTNYTVSMKHNAKFCIADFTGQIFINDGYTTAQTLTFNTGSYDKVKIVISNFDLGVGTFYFEDIVFNEGDIALPFVANIKGVKNPTIEVKGKNLLPNFSTWMSNGLVMNNLDEHSATATAIEETMFSTRFINLNIKPSETYTLTSMVEATNFSTTGAGLYFNLKETTVNGETIKHEGESNGVIITTSGNVKFSRTFTASENAKSLHIVFGGHLFTGTIKISNPMLHIGNEDIEFEEYESHSKTLLTTLYEGDKVEQKSNRTLEKLKAVNEVSLDGTLSYLIGLNGQGSKEVAISNISNFIPYDLDFLAVKHNGILLRSAGEESYSKNLSRYDVVAPWKDGSVYIDILNTDSGWGQDYTPSLDEIKAYFLGWRMYTNGETYDSYNGTGTKAWAYRGDDFVGITSDGKGLLGGTISLPTTQATINSKWQPYRLIYKLKTPVKETVQAVGNTTLSKGTNSISVSEGKIVREKMTNPAHVKSTNAYIYNLGYTHHTPCPFSLKVDKIINIYKNGEIFNLWGREKTQFSHGNENPYILGVNFDLTAIYEVEYIPLEPHKVSAPTNSISVKYQSSLGGNVSNLVKDVSNVMSDVSDIKRIMAKKDEPLQWINATVLNATKGTIRYAKDSSGDVSIHIRMSDLTWTNGAIIGTLPVGYRPKSLIYIVGGLGNISPFNGLVPFAVNWNGNITLNHGMPVSGETLTDASIDAYVSFKAEQ